MIINNKELTAPPSTSLAIILRERGFDLERVAVMVNGEIVPKNRLAETLVNDDSSVEVVTFVGGG